MPAKKEAKFSCIIEHPLFKEMPLEEDGRPRVWRTEYYCRDCMESWEDKWTLLVRPNQSCPYCDASSVEHYVSRWIGPEGGEEVWRQFQAMTRRGLCAYVVVENCGHDGEMDVRQGEDFEALVRWRDQQYGAEGAKALHVQIAKFFPDGSRSYKY